MSDSIICPKCKTEIPLTEAISHQVEERLRADFETEKARLAAEQAQQLADKDAELETALAAARQEAEAAAEARATEQVSVQMRDMETQLAEQEQLRRDAEERELELRSKTRELERERESAQLQMERQLDTERAGIAKQAIEQAEERHRFELREGEVQRELMQKRIDDLQAVIDSKRPGLQGEVLEREIEDVLGEAFPTDEIIPVKAGKRGADVVQAVRSARGGCGKLLWESKNHKHWSDGWVEKLRADQQAAKADVAIVVTSALPDGVEHVDFVRGVWVCDFASVVPLAIMLRQQVDAINQARLIETNRSQVADEVYAYVCGSETQHHVTNIVTSALTQLSELESERAAADRTFDKREKQIRAQIRGVAAFYGGLQGIAGGALQPVAALELPPGDEGPGPLALAS